MQTDVAAIIIFEAWIGPAQKFVQAGSAAATTTQRSNGVRQAIDLRGSRFPLPTVPPRTSAGQVDEFDESREEDSDAEDEWANNTNTAASDAEEYGHNARFEGVDIVSPG